MALLEPPAQGVGRIAVLGFEHDRLGKKVGLIRERPHPRLQQIGAHVEEEEQAGEQEEADDQQPGHQPDEEIRQDQLAADPPQQPPLGPDDAAREAVAGDEDDGEAADRINRIEGRRSRRRDPAEETAKGFDREAGDEQAPRKTMQQPAPEYVRPRR